MIAVNINNVCPPALAVQRYIYVCHAPVAKQWCTLSRSWIFVIFILITAILTMLPRVLDRTYEVTSIGKIVVVEVNLNQCQGCPGLDSGV